MAGLHLVAEGRNGLGGRADPGDAGRDDLGGELGVFGEEAVTGVDAVGAGLAGNINDLVHHQVGLRGGVATEGVGLVGQPDMERVAVRIGVDSHGGNALVASRADDAHCDFASVCDQHLGEVRLHGTSGLLQIC
ncbi:calcium ion binding protein [Arthrobacter sp. Hiyo4]|nr:calcium ion binding protein [Arthrobacter sp. Hiyo4]